MINPSTLPLAFNENPQVATVGYIKTNDEDVEYIKVPYETRNFRAFMKNQREGFLKIVWDKDGKLNGGTCVGHQAKEIITTIALMIKLKGTRKPSSIILWNTSIDSRTPIYCA
ncbi:hypothetical protein J6TS2_27480 [Heyndrickxia sporothermodurans]|nr:hypothetical protein J6TS2_27480 [Heyndrickxia sporothermodurans]